MLMKQVISNSYINAIIRKDAQTCSKPLID